MKSFLIIIIIFLLLNIIIQQYKYNKQSLILRSIEVMKDIFYYCEITPEMKYRFISKSVENQLGKGVKKKHLEHPELIFEIVHPEDRYLLENKLKGAVDFGEPIVVRLQHTNGQYYWFEEVSTPIYENNQLVGVAGVYRRVDDRMKKFKEIEFDLSYDKLTKVYNRSYFEKMMEYYNKQYYKLAMAIVDLDCLKLVNDRLGHRSGDEFISTTAKILKNNASEQISVCRIGGDEFAIFFDYATKETVEQYFEQVYKELETHQQNVFITNMQFSMGYAICEDSHGQMQNLYEQADRKMYEHKRSKIMQVEFHI
ncbi:MAG: sensor domain-containing diguanylate cyclase [Lysinibacillus sp.]